MEGDAPAGSLLLPGWQTLPRLPLAALLPCPTATSTRAFPSRAHEPSPCPPAPAEANSTFIEDPEMAQRLMETNPNSFRKLVATFLEANGRGYWDASPEALDRLKQLYT